MSCEESANNKKSINKGRGALTIVGSGIQAVRQFTVESQQAIKQADKVLFVIPDPITEMWIKKISPNSESLADFYVEGKYRRDIYQAMTERTLYYVRKGLNVCVVYYGHPGVFVDTSYESIKLAREEGFSAQMHVPTQHTPTSLTPACFNEVASHTSTTHITREYLRGI